MLQELGLSAVDLSKYIVTKCAVDDCPISNLQLQKILYYIQKYFLKHDSIAFYDDIEAWQFGPVVPKYKTAIENIESKIAIDKIVEEKRALDPWQLVDATHKKDGAWDKIYNGGLGNHRVIPLSYIKEESE